MEGLKPTRFPLDVIKHHNTEKRDRFASSTSGCKVERASHKASLEAGLHDAQEMTQKEPTRVFMVNRILSNRYCRQVGKTVTKHSGVGKSFDKKKENQEKGVQMVLSR